MESRSSWAQTMRSAAVGDVRGSVDRNVERNVAACSEATVVPATLRLAAAGLHDLHACRDVDRHVRIVELRHPRREHAGGAVLVCRDRLPLSAVGSTAEAGGKGIVDLLLGAYRRALGY